MLLFTLPPLSLIQEKKERGGDNAKATTIKMMATAASAVMVVVSEYNRWTDESPVCKQ